MARFFVDRPILAIIISIAFVLGGAVAGLQLPIAQFPEITPPQISVSSSYPGADAVAVEQSVATPIEQQVNGVEKMIYMRSTNASDGAMTLSVTFEVGSDANEDNILVQNRVSQANPFLPQDVRNAGFNVRKATSSPMMFISLTSPGGVYDQKFLSNFATIRVIDQLLRVAGVAEVRNFGGSDYSMRIWVRPQDLARHQLTVSDVLVALRTQNTINPAGQIGGEPAPPGTQMTITARAPGRLETPEQFGDVVVRAEPDGSLIRVKDVARVELGLLSYRTSARSDGKPGALLGVFQVPGSNALDVANAVKAQMAQLNEGFPAGLEYAVTLDTTLAISEGIREIATTLLEALVLVVLVTFIFLQSWRATLIPLLTVPVSLVGSFLFFPLLGFSINTLSLFGMVLAIGLVVDDAIVVVEAVTHHIEQGMSPRAATLKAMDEVSGPVVGIALILAAVFVPLAFVPGISGRLGQQFALTIAVSVLISAFNALSLSPALCAILLTPRPRGLRKGWLQRFFDVFERGYERGADRWTKVAGVLARKSLVTLLALGLVSGGALLIGRKLPRSFVPNEDMGYFLMDVSLPDGASLQRTREVMIRLEKMLLEHPAVAHVNTAAGFSILAQSSSPNVGLVFVALKPWEERHEPGMDAASIVRSLNQRLFQLPDARAFAIVPSSIPGLPPSGGVDAMVQDQRGGTPQELAVEVEKLLAAARKRPELANLNTSYRSSVPQYSIEAARDLALKQGVPIQDLFQTLQAFLGGVYVNDFNRFGRQWRVFLQAESTDRATEEAFQQFYVRSNTGQMVPLSGLLDVKATTGPLFTIRFNGYRAAQVTGSAAPGYSSGDALDAFEQVAKEVLPPGMSIAWSGVSYQEKTAGSAAATFGLALIAVFLVLAGLYGSWSLPFSVLLGTPVAVLGAFLGLVGRGYPLDIFTQVGLVMLVGLAAKNAILIVAFARDAEKEGLDEMKAALQGARLRLRPILMTSFAFILGCVPLWIATGAGAVARRELGTTVITGMLAATLLGAIATPALYVLVERVAKRRGKRPALAAATANGGAPEEPQAAGGAPVSRWAAVGLAALCAGCAMGPDYRRPDTPAASQQAFRGQAADQRSLADLPFWEVFRDEALKALIDEALEKSPSVRIAAARVEQARALARADGWALSPSLSAGTNASRQRGLVGGAAVATFNAFGVNASASWEVDLWGRLRRTQEASHQAFLASEEAQRGVTVSLVADVANAYFQLRALDAQKAIAEQRIAGRSRALELFQARLRQGTGNRAEVATATAQVMDARAQLADIERRRRLLENQLSVLVGSPPREHQRGATLQEQAMPPEVPAGLPSSLLERRPDLRAAEAQLHAETARVGAAVANLFPKLSLTAALGLASPSLSGLLSGRELQWSYGGALAWLAPILGREQLMAAVQLQQGRAAEVTAQYFQAVLNALREVDDALAALELVGRQVEALEAQVKAVMEQRALAESRYQSGVTSFLEVTTAEEATLPAQLALEGARAARLSALVSLYRALGGGWQAPVAAAPAPAPQAR